MLNFFQSLVLGVLNGITELIPISSNGHIVILSKLLKWQIPSDNFFLAFIVAANIGSFLALAIIFREEWRKLILGLFRVIKNKKLSNDYEERFIILILIAVIPGLLIEYIFGAVFIHLLSLQVYVAAFLILNGCILLISELYIENKHSNNIKNLTYTQSFLIGVIQLFALLPGISRLGMGISGGMLNGLSREESSKFSFMLITPLLLGFSLMGVNLFTQINTNHIDIIISGGLVSAIASFMTTKYMVKYFKTGTLYPFVYYSWILGLVSLFVFRLIYSI